MVRATSVQETEPPFGQVTVYRTVPVREPVVVYGRGNLLVIRGRDETAERLYAPGALAKIHRLWAGRTVTVKEVHDAIRLRLARIPDRTEPIPTAWQVRDLLVILCAMGLARVDASSADLQFTLRPWRES